ncbi:MAG: tRNA uridine-5-carboxymethylaminomethyl(34) synthesis enzyme MnmG, partial [Paracoccaceae bacterium]
GILPGCVPEKRLQAFGDKMERLKSAKSGLGATKYSPKFARTAGIKVSEDGNLRTGLQLLSFPDVSFEQIVRLDPTLQDVDQEIRTQVARDALYANYIIRQQRDVDALNRDEAHEIPLSFQYDRLGGLSNELVKKLSLARPATLAQAGRVEGITPAALTLILAKLKQADRKRSA